MSPQKILQRARVTREQMELWQNEIETSFESKFNAVSKSNESKSKDIFRDSPIMHLSSNSPSGDEGVFRDSVTRFLYFGL